MRTMGTCFLLLTTILLQLAIISIYATEFDYQRYLENARELEKSLPMPQGIDEAVEAISRMNPIEDTFGGYLGHNNLDFQEQVKRTIKEPKGCKEFMEAVSDGTKNLGTGLLKPFPLLFGIERGHPEAIKYVEATLVCAPFHMMGFEGMVRWMPSGFD